MRKKYLFILFIFFLSKNTSAQFIRYIVKFKDKTGTPFSINDPSKFLSPKAIERRTKQHIAIDETDLPVVPRYVDSVRLSGNVAILDISKWFNQVCIETSDAAALAKINGLPFVINTLPAKRLFTRQNLVDCRERSCPFILLRVRTLFTEYVLCTSLSNSLGMIPLLHLFCRCEFLCSPNPRYFLHI